MKINKKGFTLIELLAVIVVLGLVLSVSTYFIVVSIKNSKEKAYEVSKKGLLDSAIAYANEFNEEADWKYGGLTETTCVNAWWLVNKGMQKKESFTETNEEYKFKKSDLVLLHRDSQSKVITEAEFSSVNNVSEEDCSNVVRASLGTPIPAINTIEVTGSCTLNGETPSDIRYEFCLDDSKCDTTSNASYEFTGLTNNTNYNIKLICHSNKGDAEAGPVNVKTQALEKPVITCYNDYAEVDFKNNTVSGLTKTITMNGTSIGTIASDTVVQNVDITESTLDPAKINATVKLDDNNIKNADQKSCAKPAVVVDIKAPYFIGKDIEGNQHASGKWHKDKCNLTISSNNTVGVDIIYGTSESSMNTTYTSTISEKHNTTYYAKACEKGNTSNCSSTVQYEVKIDRDNPIIEFSFTGVYRGETADLPMQATIENYEGKGKDETIDIIKKITRAGLTAVSFEVDVTASVSDSDSGLKSIQESKDSSSYTSKSITNNINANFDSDRDHNYSLKVCDNVNHCVTETIYFRIEHDITEIEPYDIDSTRYGFKCNSNGEMLYSFYATGFAYDNNGNVWEKQTQTYSESGNEYINIPDPLPAFIDNYYKQKIRNSDGSEGYNFVRDDGNAADGTIYVTCSARTISLPYQKNNKYYAKYHYTQGVYSVVPKSGSYNWYHWDCPEFGVNGHRDLYTTTSENPYPGHCGVLSSGTFTGSCPDGFSQLSNSNKCYSFGLTDY